jgi:amidase
MALLEPGFTVDVPAAGRVGRIRPAGFEADPSIDEAVDAVLARSGLALTEVDLPGWFTARENCGVILDAEAVWSNRVLLADPGKRDLLGENVHARLTEAENVRAADLARARVFQIGWRAAMTAALRDVDVLALPTVPFYPPPLTAAPGMHFTAFTNPVNLSGFPALALPIPSAARLPASLQLIAPPGGEALLLATGAVIEAAAGYQRS